MRINDVHFAPTGMPGVVTHKDRMTEEYTVDTDRARVQKEFRHGYVNGMPPEVRLDFNKILDDVKELSNPKDRIEALQKKISEIEPGKKNFMLNKYLTAELSHMISTYGYRPTEYVTDIDFTK